MGDSLINLLVYVVVWGLILYVLFWGVGKIGLPEPFSKIAIAIIVLIAVVVMLDALLGFSGRGPIIDLRLRR